MSLHHPRIRAGWSIAAASMAGFRSTLDGLGFTEVQTPKMVGVRPGRHVTIFTRDNKSLSP